MSLATLRAHRSVRPKVAIDKPADIGGYYQPDDAKASTALRPSKTLNDILATV